jgi:CDP-glycerol glycerophosphotransferase (TagB/SpsB family)
MDNVKKYFVVSKESEDYDRLSKYGKVLDFGSKEHKFMYLLADKIISTHPYESGINPFFSYDKKFDERDNYAGLVTSQIYFLQHGVTKDNISDWMSKFDKNLSLLVTVNDQERESFYVEGYGYDKNIIQTLGFPRYDNLKNNPNKQILIIPTWRKYLRGNKNLFMKSGYYEKLNTLLNNPKFIDYAKSNGYSIIFKAHPELEKNINDTDERYIDLFDINEYVKLSTEESYQELFNNSSLLITDYSSVFYDFAYQKKPVIYYHPENDYHYEQGYFDYKTMGFGPIVENENELIETVKSYIDSGCIMDDEYVERVNNFFKYTDKNNSKRVYDWIKRH